MVAGLLKKLGFTIDDSQISSMNLTPRFIPHFVDRKRLGHKTALVCGCACP
jgi:hypothetical protein